MAAEGSAAFDAAAPDGPEPPVGELLRSVRAHPSLLPETLAVFAVRHRGPRAARRVAALRAAHPEATPQELAGLAVTHARRVSQSEGAFVGGPFMVLIPFAFCTALLAQAQLFLELAALAGRDPAARPRAAEVLVLQGAYPDVVAAGRALDTAPRPSAGRRRGLWSLLRRMARLLGLTSEGADPPPSRWRTAGGWLLVLLVFLIGLVAPLVWLPYMGFSYARATDRVGSRAVDFYFGGDVAGAALRRRRRRADPATVAATIRAGISLVLPVGAVIVLLLADIRVAGSRWPLMSIILLVLSVLVGEVWYRRHRRHRRAAAQGG
ncbi:hypothetical protein ABT263_14935 [Kitasatospora sp. NPDC001603]|uniref:hypothetical protein n=1 Tax=Kitasatospora sp. NPDC001603 TaxID=3154388 RepID=UPI00331DE416